MADDAIEIACTLGPDALQGRVEEWRQVLDAALARESIDGGWRVSFADDPALAGRIADLSVREQRCCAFFTFDLAMHGQGEVHLEIRAPEDAAGLVASLIGA
jgi:hypothetical protein